MAVDQSEILKQAVATLRVDATLIALLGEITPGEARVFNHVPQDDSKPYVAISWQADVDWDTKDSLGYDGSLDHEVVTIHHSDRDVLKVVDRIRAVYNETPIVITSGKIVCFDYQTGTVPVQVLETHRAIASFNILVDADGVGGIPVTPPTGGLIVVQDEGVDIANTPHKTLNFKGIGVTVTDAGGGEACIDIIDIPTPQIIWADNSRIDTFTPTGSRERPFLTLEAAVAAANAGGVRAEIFLIGDPLGAETTFSVLFPTVPLRIVGLTRRHDSVASQYTIIQATGGDFIVVTGQELTLENLAILTVSPITASIRMDNTVLGSDVRVVNCMLDVLGIANGIIMEANAPPAPPVPSVHTHKLHCTGSPHRSVYGKVELQFDAAIPSAGLITFEGIKLEGGLATNAAAATDALVRLTHCQLPVGGISGGNVAQTIEALYCMTPADAGASLIQTSPADLLKASDFVGAHSKIVLPVS